MFYHPGHQPSWGSAPKGSGRAILDPPHTSQPCAQTGAGRPGTANPHGGEPGGAWDRRTTWLMVSGHPNTASLSYKCSGHHTHLISCVCRAVKKPRDSTLQNSLCLDPQVQCGSFPITGDDCTLVSLGVWRSPHTGTRQRSPSGEPNAC